MKLNIKTVLTKTSKKGAGLRFKIAKCQFMNPVLECLRQPVDAQGFHPIEATVEAIKEAPTPTNLLQSSDVLVHYDPEMK